MTPQTIAIGAQGVLSLLQLTRSVLAQINLKKLVDSEDLTPEQKAELTANLLAERDATLAEWERLAPPAT